MTDHKHEQQKPSPSDADEAVGRRLSNLGPLIRRKELAESSPPNDAFVWDLWARLVGGEEPQAMVNPADPEQRGETFNNEIELDDPCNLAHIDQEMQENQ